MLGYEVEVEFPVGLALTVKHFMAAVSASAGKLLAEAITGDASRLDLFSTLTPLPFPGGTALRGPLYVLGMLWYAMRDRLRH